MRRLILVLTALGLLAVPLASSAAPASHGPGAFPEKIALPNGFAPEGIEIAHGDTFYVGSVQTGAIYTGSLRTGAGQILVPGAAAGTRGATGIEYDRGKLWVSGAGVRHGDASTTRRRAPCSATYQLAHRARDVHQRRRRDEEGRVLHRLAAARDLPRHALEARRAG